MKILVIRRDNIGDLICTLPLISSLRNKHPEAQIDVLVNSYCAPVVHNHPDIDHVFIYTKAKHADKKTESVFSVYLKRILLVLKLRRTQYDYAILANVSFLPRPIRWAKQVAAKNVIGFIENEAQQSILTHPILLDRTTKKHEVEYLMELSKPLGGYTDIPDCSIQPDLALQAQINSTIKNNLAQNTRKIIGINISARKPSQQWSAEHFIELITQLTQKNNLGCVLFWSPGSKDNPHHPGDDEKAQEIALACQNLNLYPLATHSLSELIAGVSTLDFFITADGGAMHIGAACQIPTVALFGDSDAQQWHPWGVPHVVLQPSLDVADISPSTVVNAYQELSKP